MIGQDDCGTFKLRVESCKEELRMQKELWQISVMKSVYLTLDLTRVNSYETLVFLSTGRYKMGEVEVANPCNLVGVKKT